jgi:hypothetical protein
MLVVSFTIRQINVRESSLRYHWIGALTHVRVSYSYIRTHANILFFCVRQKPGTCNAHCVSLQLAQLVCFHVVIRWKCRRISQIRWKSLSNESVAPIVFPGYHFWQYRTFGVYSNWSEIVVNFHLVFITLLLLNIIIIIIIMIQLNSIQFFIYLRADSTAIGLLQSQHGHIQQKRWTAQRQCTIST